MTILQAVSSSFFTARSHFTALSRQLYNSREHAKWRESSLLLDYNSSSSQWGDRSWQAVKSGRNAVFGYLFEPNVFLRRFSILYNFSGRNKSLRDDFQFFDLCLMRKQRALRGSFFLDERFYTGLKAMGYVCVRNHSWENQQPYWLTSAVFPVRVSAFRFVDFRDLAAPDYRKTFVSLIHWTIIQKA